MPKISFILPIYKVEKYLSRAIDSIKAQTMDDWEAILVDDGSPDNCGKICDDASSKDPRFRVIHQKNSGVSAARNAGIDVAKGEYLWFIDPDDYIEPDAAEKLVCVADENQADVVIFGISDEQTDKDDNIASAAIVPPPVIGVYRDEPFKRFFSKLGMFCLASLKLFRRDIIGDIRYPAERVGEDGAFFIYVYQQSPKCLAGIEDVCYHYCHRPDSASVTYHPERLSDCFYLTKQMTTVVGLWGLLNSEDHLHALMHYALLDLLFGIKNAGLAPMTFRQKVDWLRGIMQDQGLRKALKCTPVKQFIGRNNRLKIISLKLRMYRLAMFMSVLNHRGWKGVSA